MKSRLFPDSLFNYTPNWTIWSSKFQKFSGEGLTEPPPQTPPPLFLGLRPRFGLHPQISGASRPRFGLRPIQTPQLLKRGCTLAGLWLANFVRRQVDQRIQKPNPPPKIGQFQHWKGELPDYKIVWWNPQKQTNEICNKWVGWVFD